MSDVLDDLRRMDRDFAMERYPLHSRTIPNAIREIERLRAEIVGGNEGREKTLLWDAIIRADYLIDRLETCKAGKAVRDLDEAEVSYRLARAKAAAPAPPECGVDRGANPQAADNLEAHQ